MSESEQQPTSNEMLEQATALPYLPGTLLPYAGVNTEEVRRWLFSRGWLIANGDQLEERDFRLLWFFIRDKYGSARDGVFNIPDLQGRALVGAGQGTDLTPRALGSKIGKEDRTLREVGFLSGKHPEGEGGDDDVHARYRNLDGKINVIQPSLVVNVLIYFGHSEKTFDELAASDDKQ